MRHMIRHTMSHCQCVCHMICATCLVWCTPHVPQFKFGAREAAAPVILGLMKVSLGLLLGSSLLQLLSSFPNPMLGALLALAGVELACSARAQVGARGWVSG